jgi:DNA-binding MarR family transcriptional regulator
MDTPAKSTPTYRERPLARWHWQVAELMAEITAAAERIGAARTWGGEPVTRTDGPWRVLAAVARSHYCLSIADLGRALGVRRQVAHELAHEAARAGYIELAPNPDDRRILQAFVTQPGRGAIAAARSVESQWLAVLLNGLGDREMATATHVLRVIRQRLERDAREQARQRRQQRPRSREPWP